MENGKISEAVQNLSHPSHTSLPEAAAAPKSSQNESPNPSPDDEAVDKFIKKSDSMKADILADELTNLLAWDEVAGDWYRFANGHWSRVTDRKAIQSIESVMGSEAKLGYSRATLTNVTDMLKTRLMVDKWNESKHLLPVENGVLDIRTMELGQHSAKRRFNWCLPYRFDASSDCPVVKQWLLEAVGDKPDIVEMLRAAMFFAVAGGTSEVQFFIELLGPGGTGKSTFVRLLQALVGEGNSHTSDLKQLEESRFEQANFYGKKLIIINDSSEFGGEASNLKAATGGDPLRAEKKGKQKIESFISDAAVVIASNKPIKSSDRTSGLSRRRRPVTFGRQVTEADKAKWRGQGGLEVVLRSELPGILSWVLSMGRDAAREAIGGINGELTPAQLQHQVDTNPMAGWVDDSLVLRDGALAYTGNRPDEKRFSPFEIAKMEETKLYPNYLRWCDENGHRPASVKTFGDNLEELLSRILKLPVERLPKTRAGRAFRGIAIRSDEDIDIPTPILGIDLRGDGLVTSP